MRPEFSDVYWKILYLLPDAPGNVAFEHGVDQACRTVSIFKGRQHGRLSLRRTAFANPSIGIANEVAESVGPCLLMTARQMNIGQRVGRDQRRVFGHDLVGTIMMADPQLVLLFLLPLERCGFAVDFKHQVVLVAGQYLTYREAAF